MPEKTCEKCKNKIHLHEQQQGLVFNDNIFICEHCATTSSEEEIMEWTNSIMQSPTNGMPIALWLVHEQNKDKPMFSRKK